MESPGPLVFLNPVDCQLVADDPIVIRGQAPPGSRIVRDISLGPDAGAIASASGTWEIEVDLGEYENEFTFRIGDDRTTQRTIRLYNAAFVADSSDLPRRLEPVVQPTHEPVPPAREVDDSPWPEEWDLYVCYAVGQIDDAGNHIATMGAAMDDVDLDRVIDEANAAAQDAREARDFLDATADWQRGRQLVRHLREAADKTVKAMNVIELGVRNVDSRIVRRGTRLMQDSLEAKVRAVGELVELEADGLECF
jgi:hypothetical protein